jgi:hypothetical protein
MRSVGIVIHLKLGLMKPWRGVCPGYWRRGETQNQFDEKNCQGVISMKDRVWILPNLERAFPRMLNLLYKPISATFTNNQCDLFVDIFLQLLGVNMLGLLKDLFQL